MERRFNDLKDTCFRGEGRDDGPPRRVGDRCCVLVRQAGVCRGALWGYIDLRRSFDGREQSATAISSNFLQQSRRQRITMLREKQLELLKRAEYMLWVIAATDIDGVKAHRRIVLLKLGELESKARELGILNLYAELVENRGVSSRYSH